MTSVLLIGYGNELRGDDAIGRKAVERLHPLLPDSELASCHQLTPELAYSLADCAVAVFVDATCDGSPGEVRVRRLHPESGDEASFTHHQQPASLLALAQALYGRAPLAMLVTGCGEAWQNGTGLSETGAQALDEICRLVPTLLYDFAR